MPAFGVLSDVMATLKAWSVNLGALTFEQNMKMIPFRNQYIPARSTLTLAHKLNKIPTDVILSNQESGVLAVTRDEKFIYVHNRSTATEDAKVDVLVWP